MDDQRDRQVEQEDTPGLGQRRPRVFLILSPLSFVLCWIFARAQDASKRDALIIAAAGFIMCLFFSAHSWLRGTRASDDVFWLHLIIDLLRR